MSEIQAAELQFTFVFSVKSNLITKNTVNMSNT